MENYPSYSYPDSHDSSPRSREIDFENPPPSWEDQPQQSQQLLNKVKFMVSYGGKIQPRSHDNLLSYIGGETKILSVDRSIKFSAIMSKLSSLISNDSSSDANNNCGFTFKYQLPGEELDALISVTNDDDLENMMHEYDRLFRGSSKPARLRVFLFPVQKSGSFGSTSSDKIERESDREIRERDRFVEALNSGSIPQQPVQAQVQVSNNVDFLFGLDKGPGPVPVQVPVQMPVQRHEPDLQIDARIQELNRMQISKNEEQNMFVGAPASIPATVQIPAGYWQAPPQQPPVNVEQQVAQMPGQHHHQQFHHQNQQTQPQPQPPQQQQVYMVHAPPQGNMYHAPPMMRPAGQGYYQMQRVQSDQVYREQQPVYSGKMGGGGYSEGMGLPGRAVAGMAGAENGGYAQVAYDGGNGRQVYYAAAPPGGGGGGVVTGQFQGVPVGGSGEMRAVGGGGGDPKGVQKIVSNSNPV